VRIEGRDHTANGFLHQRVIVDLIDVLSLNTLVDLGELTRFLPRQRRRIPRRHQLTRPLSQHAAGHCGGKSKYRSRNESDQRARSHRHVLKPPGLADEMDTPGVRRRSMNI
jgi:hypothetical protein